jgi:hypothetical protein
MNEHLRPEVRLGLADRLAASGGLSLGDVWRLYGRPDFPRNAPNQQNVHPVEEQPMATAVNPDVNFSTAPLMPTEHWVTGGPFIGVGLVTQAFPDGSVTVLLKDGRKTSTMASDCTVYHVSEAVPFLRPLDAAAVKWVNDRHDNWAKARRKDTPRLDAVLPKQPPQPKEAAVRGTLTVPYRLLGPLCDALGLRLCTGLSINVHVDGKATFTATQLLTQEQADAAGGVLAEAVKQANPAKG